MPFLLPTAEEKAFLSSGQMNERMNMVELSISSGKKETVAILGKLWYFIIERSRNTGLWPGGRKKMEEKISVIVPVYNVEPYLERCLDSILQNTYRNLEIICVDDGSTDNCSAILDRYAEQDERIVVIHRENGGLSAARNSGMDVATGDYIAFIDSDDWIHPQYFEILLTAQKKGDYDLVICGFSRPTEVESFDAYNLQEINGRELNLEGIYRNRAAKTYAWGKLYRSKLTEGSRFVEGVRIAEDAAFNALVLGKHTQVRACWLDLPLYMYYVRIGSLAYQLKGKETLDLGEIFEQYTGEISSERVKRIYITEALKRGLSARYSLSLQRGDMLNLDRARRMVRRNVRTLLRLGNVSGKEKLQYLVFGYFPITYRLFRLLDDPTLWKMEKELRKKREA